MKAFKNPSSYRPGLWMVVVAALVLVPPAAGHSIGFLGGVNLATLSVDPDDGADYKNRAGFDAGGNLVFVEGRYTTGFTDINDSSSGEEVKTRGFQILGGVTFPIGD